MPPGCRFVFALRTRPRIALCLVAGVRGCLMNVLYDERADPSTPFPKLVETQGAAAGLTDASR